MANWFALAKFSASCKIRNMPTQQLDYFATLVAEDEHFPLTEACIAVAQHAFPDLDVQHILDEIDQLGDRLKTNFCRCLCSTATPTAQAFLLHRARIWSQS
jgi:hypothetical protein